MLSKILLCSALSIAVCGFVALLFPKVRWTAARCANRACDRIALNHLASKYGDLH